MKKELHAPIVAKADKEGPMKFPIDDSWLIPIRKPGHAVSSAGWTYTADKPTSITWHWTATKTRKQCDELLGGDNALRRPVWDELKQKWMGGASAHYCIGRTYEEGISQYVKLQHRSWHAGAGQVLRWDGKKINADGQWLTGARASIGVETVEVGFARSGIPKEDDWTEVYSTNGKFKMWVEPWPQEQIDMMIFVGKKIVKKYPNIEYLDHHGHMDICPGVKEDPSLAFPFAKVLSGIYNRCIPDVWSPFANIKSRQKALELLGYDLGRAGIDGDWGRASEAALLKYQSDNDLVSNGQWSTFVCWNIYFSLNKLGLSLKSVDIKA